LKLLFQFLNGDIDRSATHGGRATSESSDAVLDDARVAVNDGNVVDINA